MSTLKDKIMALPDCAFTLGDIQIRPIRDDYDLWFAVVECQLAPGQEDYVNPAGFSIGRAFLHPNDNIPCIILKNETRVGFIVLRKWSDKQESSWSYYLDKDFQGLGFGKTAGMLAINVLQKADPESSIKLSTEKANRAAQRLYRSLGFVYEGETDGDDLVFVYRKASKI